MKYFNNIQTLEELKRAYRRLAMQHHRAASNDFNPRSPHGERRFQKLGNKDCLNEWKQI